MTQGETAGNKGRGEDVVQKVPTTTRSAVHVEQRTTVRSAITVAPLDEGSLVSLVGDVDGSLRDQASMAMADVLRRGGPVVVDLAGVTFIDSSGLAFVLQLHRLGLDDPSQPCVLRDPPTLVLDLLEVIGLAGQVSLEFSAGGDMPLRDPLIPELDPAEVPGLLAPRADGEQADPDTLGDLQTAPA